MNVRTQTHLRAHCSNWLKLTYGFRFSVFFRLLFLAISGTDMYFRYA